VNREVESITREPNCRNGVSYCSAQRTFVLIGSCNLSGVARPQIQLQLMVSESYNVFFVSVN
jgi:hypothetical protein